MSTTIPGATIARADLHARAEELHRRVTSDSSNPYRSEVGGLNDFFLAQLDKYKQPTLGEIKAVVDAQVAKDSKTKNIALLAGLGMIVGGFVVGPMVGLPSLARMGLLVGGFYASNVVAGKAGARASTGAAFSQQLTNWGAALSASRQPGNDGVAAGGGNVKDGDMTAPPAGTTDVIVNNGGNVTDIVGNAGGNITDQAPATTDIVGNAGGSITDGAKAGTGADEEKMVAAGGGN